MYDQSFLRIHGNSLVNNVTLFLDTILQERNLETKDS